MRHTTDTINDNDLDALYERLAIAEAAVERVMQLGTVLRDADAPDGSPSPLRPAGELIVAVASRTFTEAATGIAWARDCYGNAVPAACEQEAVDLAAIQLGLEAPQTMTATGVEP